MSKSTTPQIGDVIKRSFSSHPFADRIRFFCQIVVMVSTAIPYAICYNLLLKLGLIESPVKPVFQEVVPKRLYQMRYGGPSGDFADCRSTLVVSADGKRAIFISPPKWTKERDAALAAIAPLAAIVLPSFGHDVHTGSWAEKHPSVPVLTMDEAVDYAITEKGIKSDVFGFSSPEGSSILSSVGITSAVPVSFTSIAETYFVIKLSASSSAVLTCCGLMNADCGLPNLLLGFGGLRLSRFFSLMFVHDIAGAAETWREMGRVPNLTTVLFLHGEPLVGTPASIRTAMDKACIENGRHFFIRPTQVKA